MSIDEYRPAARSVALLALDESTRASLCRVAHAAKFEVLAANMATGLDGPPLPFADVIVADLRDQTDAAIDEGLAHHIHDTNGHLLILLVTLDTLDIANAAFPEAQIIVGADELDLHLAFATAAARLAGGGVSDITNEEGLRLQRLADEIARIARTLIELPDGLGTGSAMSEHLVSYRAEPAADAAGMRGGEITAAEVRAIIRLRRMRERFFSSELFADPAWDMLLDLAAARIERARVAVSSLCIAAAVPPTTALRWIKAMTDRGLLRRVADPHDARRIFIQLSDEAATAMDRYLRAARVTIGAPI